MKSRVMILALAALVVAVGSSAETKRILSTNITARLIQAKEEGPEKMDPALADIESKLKSVFKYKQYEQLSSQKGSVSAGSTLKMKFPDNLVLESTFLGGNKDQRELSLRWTRRIPKQRPVEYFYTRVRIKQGEAFVMAGPKSNGGVLLLSVTAD